MTRFRELVWVLFLTMAPSLALSQSEPATAGTAWSAASRLGPGDYIVVKIWREPDLSDTVQVDNSGLAVFPKLGPIRVTGTRPDSLEPLLVQKYGTYLQNPSIRVTVLRRITIWGAVARPGPYPVDMTMSITDALSLAGGPTSNGKVDQVELRRGGLRRVLKLSESPTGAAEVQLRSGDQLFVPERSWLDRNTGLVVAAAGTVTSLLFLLARE